MNVPRVACRGLCEWCAKPFAKRVPVAVFARYGRVRFCDDRCAKTAWQARRRARVVGGKGVRRCRVCGRTKPLVAQFWARSACNAAGLRKVCKACQRRREQQRMAAVLEARQARWPRTAWLTTDGNGRVIELAG